MEYGNYRKDKYERGKRRKTKRRIEDKNEGLEIDTVNGGKRNVKKRRNEKKKGKRKGEGKKVTEIKKIRKQLKI